MTVINHQALKVAGTVVIDRDLKVIIAHSTLQKCIGCKCTTCIENSKSLNEIKEILTKKINLTETKLDAAAVNLC